MFELLEADVRAGVEAEVQVLLAERLKEKIVAHIAEQTEVVAATKAAYDTAVASLAEAQAEFDSRYAPKVADTVEEVEALEETSEVVEGEEVQG